MYVRIPKSLGVACIWLMTHNDGKQSPWDHILTTQEAVSVSDMLGEQFLIISLVATFDWSQEDFEITWDCLHPLLWILMLQQLVLTLHLFECNLICENVNWGAYLPFHTFSWLMFIYQYGKDYEYDAPVKLLVKHLHAMAESPDEQLVVVSQVWSSSWIILWEIVIFLHVL